VRAGVLRGMYRFEGPAEVVEGSAGAPNGDAARRATLLFSGPMWQVAMEARAMLAADWGVSADAWSVTSYTELREDALSVERANRLHPHAPRAVPYVSQVLADGTGPVVAVTDYLRAVPDQVARWVPRPFLSLGTDGFGRSDTRAALRRFFEVDAAHLVVAVLSALVETGDAKSDEVAEAISRYEIDADSADPWSD
jgi:pyruvate dehydrogenase E1 component